MEFRHFVQLIAIGLQARIPMHMTGFPGVGKTEFTKSLEAGFDRVGIKCRVVVLVGSIREPQDFGGFPVSTPDGVRHQRRRADAEHLGSGEDQEEQVAADPDGGHGLGAEAADPVEIHQHIQRLEEHRHQHVAGGLQQVARQ